MKVREILTLAASCLGAEEVRGSLSGDVLTEEGKELLDCFNVVENEIALDYYPLKKRQTVSSDHGVFSYAAFESTPADILSVRTPSGEKVRFRLFPDRFEADVPEAEVLYSYLPSVKKISDESELGGKISARLMAYGVVSEYLLRLGKFSEAKLWAIRYRDCLKAAGILRHPLSVRSRRWA